MITLNHISKSYDEKKVLHNFSCTFTEGKITAVMGPSGIGKTTLFSLLLGLMKPDEGTISGLEGKKISVLFQEDRLFPFLTAKENAIVAGEGPKDYLALLGLKEEENSLPSALSGGMQRRVAMARALNYDGEIFLLDEPFKGLDPETKEQAMTLFRNLTPKKTIIFITHDEKEAESLADEILILDERTALGESAS